MKKRLFFALIVACISLTIYATPTNLSIVSFSPVSGVVGTTVTISGTNFNTTLANNVVYFGATRATVTNATSTSLTVTVPNGATYMPISVTDVSTGLTAYSAKPFIVTFSGSNAFDSQSFADKVGFFTFNYNGAPSSVLIGDIDGDGKGDIIMSTETNYISVYRNTSTNEMVSFATKVDFTVGSSRFYPFNTTIGDIDGDGMLDLAVANYTSKTVSILRNTSTVGTISFSTKVDYATETDPSMVSIGDLDGDGKPDLAVVNSGTSNISIFRNIGTKGTISFDAKVDYSSLLSPTCVKIGDLDGDGKCDLVVANFGNHTFSIFRNTSTSGAISFAPKVDFSSSQFSNVTIGDIDGDDKPDLTFTGLSSTSIFRNTSTLGSFSFASKIDFYAGGFGGSASLSDLDGDSKLDLAVANISESTISVFRNTSTSGSISFMSKVDYATGNSPGETAIGDLNGDGKPDIVGSDVSLSVLKSQIAPASSITSFTPTTATSGVTVTITGTNFTGASSVKFGGVVAHSYNVVSATTITAVVGAGQNGSISVSVPTRGIATSAGFTYTTPPAPTISSFTPTAANTDAIVTITGTNLIGTTAVSFGGTAAKSYTVTSSTNINAIVAAGASGNISITTPGGTVSLAGFTYLLSQTISFGTLSTQIYGVADIDPGATASSSLAITYTSSNPNVATIVSNKIHIVGAGVTTIYANQSGNSSYAAAPEVSKSLTVSAKSLTLTGVTASNKVYDGTNIAPLSGGSLNGIINSDDVTITAGTGVFVNKNIGTGKTVTVSGYSLSGTKAGNYTLAAQPTGLTANITAKTLTISGVTASNKVYNGTTSATLSGGSLNGIVGSDVVTLSAGTGVFADKNIGTGKTITASGYALTGAGASNYTLAAQPSALTANITAKTLTITGVTVSNKVYDGAITATLNGGSLNGIVIPDIVTLNVGVGVFADKNVGTAKSVTASGYALSGAGANNYSLTGQPTGLTANILPKSLTISGVVATNKVYDGTTTSVLSGGTLEGIVNSDVVTIIEGKGVFVDKNIGTGKTIAVSGYSLSGAGAGNYTLTAQPTGLTANISAKLLTISGVTASNKVYDGTATATLSGGTLNGIVNSDVVAIIAGKGVFDDKNIGDGKTITASGYGLSGAGAGNYILENQPSGLTANITAKTLTISDVTASNKVYDGTITATLSGGTLNGVVNQDIVNISVGTGQFANKNVGYGKTATASGYSLLGVDAGNYLLSAQPTGLTANITAKPLSITGVTANNKIYDGTTTAVLSGGILNGILGSDIVNITAGTGAFADKNVGIAKTVVISGYALSGAGAGNYSLSAQPKDITANITQASLTVTANNKSKVQGTANPVFSFTYSGFVNNETESVLTTLPIASCVANNASTVGDYDITLAGGASNNYSFKYVKGTLTVNAANVIRDASTAGYSVYPNPAKDFVIIKNTDNTSLTVKVYDITGSLKLQRKIDNGIIDLKGLSSGIYNLQFDGYNFKILKQ